ncbi:hypothetical protein [Petropleomorpha daqingensis]|uniref:PknH-like extracellular domain-containing protein n=1 Tax=Petropleomorpha daqingensis TaxID=2026353 RepID=A0A853C9A4_9ACTN|nr:hypothetical protein [Petropleomorpha daqingensis]NYJ03759.1 hypothetical protein [Petropleomorpha daqingensis]
MSTQVLRSRRNVVLGAGLLAGAVLTGCAATAGTRTTPAAATEPLAAPAAATSTESSAPSSSSSDLTKGLLPADAFGAGASVRTFTLADLGSWDDGDHSMADVVPPECKAAVDQVMTQFDQPQDAAAEWARADGVQSLEVLAVPAAPVDAVAQVRSVAEACGSATFTHDDGDGDHHGSAAVTVAPLSGVPDGMAAFSLTFSGDWSGGTWTTTSYLGVAQDGDRVVGLAQMSWHDSDTAVDPASFTALLDKAYQVQHDALG